MLNRFASPISSLLDARADGHSLPAGLYTRDDVFEADLDVFFMRHWIYVGLECEVPEAGDAVVIDIGKISVILLRDDENEIRVIIGPNGAGKTTVLDLICGRTKATSGSIRFDGRELTRMREHEIVHAGVGRKFQNPSIYEDLTVFENLELSFPRGRSVFGALTFRRDKEVIERVEEVAELIFL